uniref:Uncharacterized protein n=1 Tax=Opuntia streptacantha TaxID=393608 RepID=A0A7C9CQL0_OPUST
MPINLKYPAPVCTSFMLIYTEDPTNPAWSTCLGISHLNTITTSTLLTCPKKPPPILTRKSSTRAIATITASHQTKTKQVHHLPLIYTNIQLIRLYALIRELSSFAVTKISVYDIPFSIIACSSRAGRTSSGASSLAFPSSLPWLAV